MKKLKGVECPHCGEDLCLEELDLGNAKIYAYCDNKDCIGHINEIEYFIDLSTCEVYW
jgi:hypothetical protein